MKMTLPDYLEAYTEQIAAGRSLDSAMKDYEKVKFFLSIRVYDPERNKEYLKDKPHTACGELAAAYRIQNGEDVRGDDSITVTNSMQNMWGISTQQLHRDVVVAGNARGMVCLYRIEDAIDQMNSLWNCPNLLQNEEPLVAGDELYVLTNRDWLYGASVIVQNNIMEKIGEKLGMDFYVLPSSTHEVLIVPDDGKISLEELEEVVKDVNDTQVAPGIQLSDKVQYYERNTRSLGRKRETGVLQKLSENKREIEGNGSGKRELGYIGKKEPSL